MNNNYLKNTTKLNSLKHLEYKRKNIYLDILYNKLLSSIEENDNKDIQLSYINACFSDFNFKINKLLKSDVIPLIIIPLVSNCNLNCRHCDSFAPLCEEDTYNHTNDGIILSLKTLLDLGFEIKEISLEGGEPLLYKNLDTLLTELRKILPVASITITTNGTLVNNLKECTLESIINNNVLLIIDQYFNTIKEFDSRLKDYIIINKSYSDTGYFYKASLDLSENMNYEINSKDWSHYLLCEKSHTCITLIRDELFICGKSAYIRNFNNYFKTEFPSKGLNVLNSTKEDIINFISKPCALCKYCKPLERTNNNWLPSNKSIEEWV